MSKPYRLRVNNSVDFSFEAEQITALDALKTDASKYHVISNNKSYRTQISHADLENKEYEVIINNNVYNIHIYNELDELIKEMGFEIGSSKKVNEIKAPMPGLILDINVIIGSEVREDDPLMVLEAMKMENVLTSPRDGIIKSISVDKGAAVDKNQLLIEFE